MKRIFTFLMATILCHTVFASGSSTGNWRWRNNDGNEATATFTASENVPITLNTTTSVIRLREALYTNGAGNTGYFKLQYTSTSLATPNASAANNNSPSDANAGSIVWTDVTTNGTGAFTMAGAAGNLVNSGSALERTTDISGTVIRDDGTGTTNLTTSSDNYDRGFTYTTTNGNTSAATVSDHFKYEFEFAIKPGSAVLPSTVYYFRVVASTSATFVANNQAPGGHLSVLTTAPNGGSSTSSGVGYGGTVSTKKAGNGYPYLITSAAILPISLKEFNVVLGASNNAEITWTTSTENNSAEYVIESGTDGKSFAPLGTVISKNLSIGSSYFYSYMKGLPTGINYFRLKAVDKDGSSIYGPVKTINVPDNNVKITISPNPLVNTLNIMGLKNGNTIQLYTINAKKILSVIATGTTVQSVNVSSLAQGIYYVQILSEGKVISNQMVIK